MILVLLGLLLSISSRAEEVPVSATPMVRHAFTAEFTVPQPLSLGYEMIFPDLPALHFFGEAGYFYLPLTGHLENATAWSLQAGARFFPFQNWFYLSGALGFRQIGLAANISTLEVGGSPIANDANLALNAIFFGAAVGGQWFLSQKLAISFDLGVQLPIPGLHWGTTTIEPITGGQANLSVDSTDLTTVTNLPVPQIALVRFIWYID